MAETAYITQVGSPTSWGWEKCDYDGAEKCPVGSEILWAWQAPTSEGLNKTPQGGPTSFIWGSESAPSEEKTEEQTQVSNGYAINYHNNGRAGQHLTIPNRKVTKLAFWIRKRGSPTGNVTMNIRRVSDDGIILSKVWGAANALSTDYSFVEVEFETPETINEEVRLSCEADVQGYGNDIFYMYQNTDVKADQVHSRYLAGAWADQGSEDCAYRYKYYEV
ncbi:hypothetical protein ES703_83160 [subsurface metagenome]